MAIKINFDATHNPEEPILVLARRNGDKLGLINAKSIEITDSLNDATEMSFNVYKYIDDKKDQLWDLITNFKLVYCQQLDKWFEAVVEIDESNETVKTVMCKLLGCAELSQTMLYNIEINTEIDIERDDYIVPTVLFRENDKSSSLLHRILEKAPHYSIKHVDETIKNIQRTFSFSDTSIYDACQEIAEEIGCLFVFDSNSDENGKIQRTISVYDLESNCRSCGYRGEFFGACPECGQTDINDGYGEDTTIFVTSDEIADDIQFTTDTDEIKNCFKLEAGDDLMTATIKNCNPNGSDYIWYISDAMKEDMSEGLVLKLKEYDELYERYQTATIELDKDMLEQYNNIVLKYRNLMNNNELEFISASYDEDKQEFEYEPIEGFSSLIDAYYNMFDMYLYLKSGLMPTIETAKPSMADEVAKLSDGRNISPVAVNVSTSSTLDPLKSASVSTVDNIVLSMAKTIVDSRYKVKVADGSVLSAYVEGVGHRTWTGHFVVSTYANDEDEETMYSTNINVTVNADYETFVRRKLDKSLHDNEVEDMSIASLFKKDEDEFAEAIKEYSLNRLQSFYDACQSCIDIMIEQGVADGETWGNAEGDANLYENLYEPYYNKLSIIQNEIAVRDSEIALIVGSYDENEELKVAGVQNIIEEKKNEIQNALDFEKFLGEELWIEFCSFRREDKYSNDNYISEGLNNAEMISKANEFVQVAQKEIYKSAERQCSISAGLKNLLVIKKFEPLVDMFKTGNWLRVMVDDNVYKLRLVNYSINYDDLSNISVEFSDTVRASSTVKSIQDVLSQASSMATSYSAVQRQAKQGEESSSVIDNWFANGLDATNVNIVGGADGQTQSWDSHGMLFREYDSATREYSPEQMKIVNSTMAITDDNWQTIKTAVGKFHYLDPVTGEMKMVYGINAETVIGRFILGENLLMQNESGNMVFDNNGLTITSGTDDDIGTMTFNENGLIVQHGQNAVTISPQDEEVINITHGEEKVFKVDENGELSIDGNIMARSLSLANGVTIDSGVITDLADIAISASYKDLIDEPTKLSQFENDGVFITKDANNLTNYYKKTETNNLLESKADTDSLSNVATSGKYTDLIAGESDNGKLLYVKDGKVTSINIDDLKELLGM